MKRSLKQIGPEAQKKPRKRATTNDHGEVDRLNALVTSLKGQIKVLQAENASLKKEKEEAYVQNVTIRNAKTALLKSREVSLKQLPKDVVNLTIKFFSEFEKFQLRVLNKTFYEAYYNQTFACRTGTNYKRVAKLGALGRKFPKLTHLRIYYDSLDQDFLQFVDKKRFPNLELFAVEKFGTEVNLTKLSGHPKIKTMGLYNMEPHMLEHVTEENFPKLELLDFYPFRCRFLENFLAYLQPHSKLKRMEFLYVSHLNIEDWKVVTKLRFPSLETILYRRPPKDDEASTQLHVQNDTIPKVMQYFKDHGIDFRPEEVPEEDEVN